MEKVVCRSPEGLGGNEKARRNERAVRTEAERSGSRPTVRLHLWLERNGDMCFGAGRAQLLFEVERLGSLKKAAESLGMSYRAAWGKIQQSERILGFKLVESRGSRRQGIVLTSQGRAMAEQFRRWFERVESAALAAAAEVFPFQPRSFQEDGNGAPRD
ncbi:LysR family transcriptional regulator [Desulfovibrio aminophilus]|nr:LysR family transcriptional regulator [Desulfovibrio aminophilus]MCM0756398.1 LysR family transcriptional regulator [Desulfovibrio aminophilus]